MSKIFVLALGFFFATADWGTSKTLHLRFYQAISGWKNGKNEKKNPRLNRFGSFIQQALNCLVFFTFPPENSPEHIHSFVSSKNDVPKKKHKSAGTQLEPWFDSIRNATCSAVWSPSSLEKFPLKKLEKPGTTPREIQCQSLGARFSHVTFAAYGGPCVPTHYWK